MNLVAHIESTEVVSPPAPPVTAVRIPGFLFLPGTVHFDPIQRVRACEDAFRVSQSLSVEPSLWVVETRRC